MVSGAGAKQKGDAYCREVAAHIHERIPAIRPVRQIHCSDENGGGRKDLGRFPGVAAECKRVEALSFREAMRQAERNAPAGEVPVVITRRNREAAGDSLVVLRLDAFLDMYAAWIAEEAKVAS